MSPTDTAPALATLSLATLARPGAADRMPPQVIRLPAFGYARPGSQELALQEALEKLRQAEERMAAQQERIEALEALALTDELTGLLNRRGFLEAFRRELAAGRRAGGGGVLVMVDLDGFKGINDTHGHLAGDHYLQQVARALQAGVRGHDIVARLGGDEFVVLLTGAAGEQGLARAAALAEHLNSGSCNWNGERLPLRASFGAEPFEAADRPEDVLRRADVRMYQTKSKRRKAAR